MVTVLVTCSRAHPRSHGENRIIASASSTPTGSSPLTRGKQGHLHVGFLRPRLIPTHAGKTKPARAFAGGGWAHPRSRGENLSRPRTNPSGGGSSPLTRGKLSDRAAKRKRVRLIPAHAGKTSVSCSKPDWWWAHPRSCRENANARACSPVQGAHPHSRGEN